MADKVVGKGIVQIGAEADLSDVRQEFDVTATEAIAALREMNETIKKSSTEIGQGFGELSDSNQNLKDGFGDLSSSASAVGAGLVSAGLVSEETGAKFTAVADILGGVEGAFTALQGAGTLASGVLGKLTNATKLQTVAQRALNLALRANPIGIVVTVLAALVAGFVVAYKKSETFRNIVNGALNAVKRVALSVWDAIKTAANVAFKLVATYVRTQIAVVKAVLRGVLAVGKTVWGGIRSVATGAIDGIVSAAGKIGAVFSSIWDGVRSAGQFAFDSLRNGLNAVISGINKAIGFVNKIPGVPDVPSIPMLASGTRNFAGGLAIVGERGPELVRLPRGSDVFSNGESQTIAAGSQSVVVNMNNFGPQTGADKLRELLWTLRYATRVGATAVV